MTVFLERVILAILTALALFLVLGPNPMHFNWPQRIGSLLVLLALAGLVSWAINRLNKKPASTSKNEGRVFVPIAPKEITAIYDGKTEAQGDQAAAIYIGKWLQVSGKVSDVSSDCKVQLQSEGDNPILFLRFPREEFDRLQILPRGHFLTANGQIKYFSGNYILLINCELLKTAPT